MEKSKVCSKCRKIKDLTEFCINNNLKSGFHSQCKACVNKRHKERRSERKKLGLCRECSKPLDRVGLTCIECNKKSTKALVKKHRGFRKQGLCGKCGDETIDSKYLCKSCSDKGRANRVRLITEIYNHYGGAECACCREKNWEFLSIDHIHGKGLAHRRELGVRTGYDFARWLKRQGFPEGYRVLCMNCNCSLGSYGYCPHKSRSRKDIENVKH